MATGRVAEPAMPREAGALFVAATPIGNLGDVSTRLKAVLESAGRVAAEDTRRTGRLLQALGVRAAMISLHAHNERARIAQLLRRLLAGENVVLVSDAGTPGISDPGMRLVREARRSGVRVTPVPGPCAAVAALSVAGFPADRFHFEGFLPARSSARRARLRKLKSSPDTLVFFEAIHRLAPALDDLCGIFGAERKAFLARELTKLHESAHGGNLGEIAAALASGAIAAKGEFTLVVGGGEAAEEDGRSLDQVLLKLLEELPTGQAARLGAAIAGCPRRRAYQRALELAGST